MSQIENTLPEYYPISSEKKRWNAEGNTYFISEKWYKAIIQNTSEGFFITDIKGNFLDVNDAFCSMSGYTRNELLKMGLYDIELRCTTYPEDRMMMEHYFQKVKEQGDNYKEFLEVKHKRKDGKIIDVSVCMQYMNVKGGILFHFNRDISENKRLFHQLKEQEELYRCLIELGGNIGEAVVMLKDTKKTKGLHVFVSDKWPEMTGYSEEELLGMSFFDIVRPDDRTASFNRHGKKTKGVSIPDSFELFIIRKDGKRVPIELTSAASTYQGERVNVAYIRDVTRQKKLENELMKQHDRLQNLVVLRTAKLQEMNEKLEKMYEEEKELRLEIEEQMAIRTNFIKTLAHELKTPLTPMLGTGSILIHQAEEIGDETLLRMARNINRGAEHLNRRIIDLMDYVSGVSDRIQLRYGEVDPVKLLSQTVTYVTPEAEIKRQSLLLHIKNHLPILYADEDRLRQVILNLLNNAMKFTPPEGHITVSADLMDSKLIVEVEDDGCGIDESEKEKIFQSEGKLETEVRKHDGFGIGLPLSKMLIELHGGKIWCESEKGHGSKFSFYIPVKSCEDGFK